MTTLEPSFEADAREVLLEQAEHELVGKPENIMHQLVQAIHDRLRGYAARFDYDVESTIESLGQIEVERSRNTVTARVGWESEQMARWEFGTSAHTIEGDPILSFVWTESEGRADDPPDWVKEEFDQARDPDGRFRTGWRVFFSSVSVKGIPPSRAIRNTMNRIHAGGSEVFN